jgi:choline dehydrogenase-like flavoprotein
VQAAQTTEFDAIVVGSGISGGWAAKELTEKGLKVLLLERGRNVEHIKDYKNATKGPWEYPHRGGRTQQMIADYPVLKRDYPLNEKNLDFWVNDEDIAVHRGQALRLVSRLPRRRALADVGTPELPLQRHRLRGQREGRHRDVDWPIRYAEIAPWYDVRREVRRHLRVAREPAAAARWRVPAGLAAQLRRGACRRASSRSSTAARAA